MFDKLFEPIQIRGMELRNRVVMSAMGTHESAESEDGKSVTDKLIAYHVARAKASRPPSGLRKNPAARRARPFPYIVLRQVAVFPA